MKKAIAVFDMDGTILNTLEDLKDSLNYCLSASGFPERSLEEVRRFVGNGIHKLIERGVPAGSDEAVTERVYTLFNEYYPAHCAIHTAPYPGIPELLKTLKKGGWKIAVVSNKADYAVQPLCKQYFGDVFDYAVGEKPGVRKKPAPDAVEEVLRVLQEPRSAAVYIGDSEVDVATAAAAGIPCIAVDWGFRTPEELRAAGADRIVSDCEALLHALEE